MKKGTEGYVLIYVLVVFILLGLACATVCTFALNGLKVQRAALESDQQRYAAEGRVEQLSALMLDSSLGPVKLSDDEFTSSTNARANLVSEYTTMMEDFETDIENLTVSVEESSVWDDEADTCTFKTGILAKQEGQQVSAVLLVTLRVDIESYLVDVGEPDPETGVQPTETRWKYSVTSVSLSYDSYQIQAAEPEGGGA